MGLPESRGTSPPSPRTLARERMSPCVPLHLLYWSETPERGGAWVSLALLKNMAFCSIGVEGDEAGTTLVKSLVSCRSARICHHTLRGHWLALPRSTSKRRLFLLAFSSLGGCVSGGGEVGGWEGNKAQPAQRQYRVALAEARPRELELSSESIIGLPRGNLVLACGLGDPESV